MLDDAVRKQGRQTKRNGKGKILLLIAALSVGAVWAFLHWDALGQRLVRPASLEAGIWTPSPEGGAYGSLTRQVLHVGGGRITVLGDSQRELEWPEGEAVVVSRGGYGAVYAPGGTTLALVGQDEQYQIEVPTGIDAAAAGPQGQAAVITAGSGYDTETRVFSPAGEQTDTIGLTGTAMVMLAFLENGTLASCCVSRDGTWSLRLEGVGTFPLEAELVYDLRPCGRGLALWTSEGVSFYGPDGGETGRVEIEDSRVLDWDCGGFAALLVRRFGQLWFLIVTPEGETVQCGPLSRQPSQVLVSGNSVCTLDSEAMLVYDKKGALVLRDESGGRASSLLAVSGGAVLIGDGELMYIELS